MSWAALAGGVGGAKFARGLAKSAFQQHQTLHIIVNTGDDFAMHGLAISPDIDTMLYTLSGAANPDTGWGIAEDTFAAHNQLAKLGAEPWFWLGDRDLATHILRTQLLREGHTLTQVTTYLAQQLGVPEHVHILPMTDSVVATELFSNGAWLAFQEYFVKLRHDVPISAIRFQGIETAQISQEVSAAVADAEMVFFCPSNPLVSVEPILATGAMRALLAAKKHIPRIGVSPIIGGKALKGPADRMMTELGAESSALGVARYYKDLLDIFVIDNEDAALQTVIERETGMRVLVANTVMRNEADSVYIAEHIIQNL